MPQSRHRARCRIESVVHQQVAATRAEEAVSDIISYEMNLKDQMFHYIIRVTLCHCHVLLR